MYTESFMGDIDAILMQEEFNAKISKPQPIYYVSQSKHGRTDQFGLSKLTKLTICAHLRSAWMDYSLGSEFLEPVIIDMTECGMGKIVVKSPKQAAALYKKLTGESILH
jgi:hypothetical protein